MSTATRKNENNLTRIIESAIAGLSIVTVLCGLIILATKPKDKDVYKWAVYAALLGGGGGAIAGSVVSKKAKESDTKFPTGDVTRTNLAVVSPDSTWKDWRNFVVIIKAQESAEITSFYLKPQDGGEIPNFLPGQFLTIKLDIPGQSKPVIRTYSLSDYTEPCEYYRLSIKREPAPANLDVSPGIASNFMHDNIHEGDIIAVKPPSGKFVLDPHKSIPAVLISNGVGITPMIGMAKACSMANPDRPIWFVHGARDKRYHAFEMEIRELAAQKPNLHVHFAYSRPRNEDEGYFHSTGYADSALIRTLVTPDAEFFLCGSPSFMQSLRDGLKAWGVSDDRVFFEAFTKAKPNKTKAGTETAEIIFTESDRAIAWDSSHDSILEFAEANDLAPPYSCRVGVCGTCACKIREGEVEYQEQPSAQIDRGEVLICISKPKTDRVVLEL